jgi:hypothetical protein
MLSEKEVEREAFGQFSIQKSAIRIFSRQGFETTSTLQTDAEIAVRPIARDVAVQRHDTRCHAPSVNLSLVIRAIASLTGR